MILVDTSVWIHHLRENDAHLARLLDACRVLMHPFVLGELALGNLRQRSLLLSAWQGLPSVSTATDEEVQGFIETQQLFGRGIGYVDCHLLAATKLTPEASLWTRDKALAAMAERLNLQAAP